MSKIKKFCYWISVVGPMVNFCRTFWRYVRYFGDLRQYLEELNEFNSTFDVNFKSKKGKNKK